MTSKDSQSSGGAKLRKQAEEISRNKAAQKPEPKEPLSLDESRRLLHELQVHQIELEMQNEELRQAHRELEISQARYFDLYDLAPISYCTLSDRGLILEANLAATTLLGVAKSALFKQPLALFIVPDDQDIYYLHCKKLFEKGKPQECELRMVKKDGTIFWAHLAAKSAQDTKGEPICHVAISNIADRKHAEEALQQRTHDLGERVKELNCIHGLSELIETSGDSIEELMQGVVELLPRAWQYPSITCARVTFDGQIFNTANFEQTPWRQQRPICVNGAQVGIVEVGYLEGRPDSDEGPFLKQEGWLLDVIAERLKRAAERIQTRQTLRVSEERFQIAINATKDGLWEWDIQTNQGFFSPRCCEIIGYSFDDPELPHTYDSWVSRIHPDDYDRVISAINNYLKNGTEYNVEYRYMHKSGEYRWLNSRCQAVYNESGKPIKMVGCISDITERICVEKALRESEERYRTLFSRASDGIVILSVNGDLVDVNESFARMHGYSTEEMLLMNLKDLDTTETYQLVPERMRRLLAGESLTFEVEQYHKDGHVFPLEVSASLISSGGESYIQCFHRDITKRKRATEALRESEAHIRNITDQMSDVLFATDNFGFITFMSPSAWQLFDWKPEDITGRNFIDLLPEQEIPDAVAQFQDVINSGCTKKELAVVMKRKDESTFPGEMNFSALLKNGRITGTIGIIRDITERKKMEEALKESEERYRNQVEAINDVAYAIGSHGEYTYISPVVRNVLGYEPEEMTGRPFIEFVHEEDQDYLKRKFSELSEGLASHDDYRAIDKYGDIKWVRSFTRPIIGIDGFAGGRGILIDITKSKQAEDELSRGKEFLNTVLDNLRDSLMVLDPDNYTILRANKTFLNSYGLETDAAIGKHCYELTHNRSTPCSLPNDICPLAETIKTGKPSTMEHIHYDHNGSKLYVEVSTVPIISKGGEIHKIIHLSRNVTERKQAEQMLWRQKEELSQVSRLATVGEFAASIAHEIHQPLAAILNNAQAAQNFLSSETPAVDEVRYALMDIIQDDRRASEVISHLRSFLKREKTAPAILDINAIIGEVLTILHREITNRNIYVTPDLAPDIPHIEGDRIELQQVIMNLILNACDSLVDADLTRRQMHIRTSVAEPNSIVVAVQDSGAGLDTTEIDRLFKPFYTTKPEGLGMGLSISKSIIATHGGRIWAENNPEGGATFYFALPIYKG